MKYLSLSLNYLKKNIFNRYNGIPTNQRFKEWGEE